ncbi:glycosyltransferase [Psychrosphaera haliotis]|nr:glycosyltransferase [Psychrosphaera haliotis]
MDKYNFIVLAPNKWDGTWMNRQHIFSLLGKDHNVIYSNGPLFYWDYKLTRFKETSLLGHVSKRHNIKLLEFGKILTRVPRLKLLDKFIKFRFKRQIEKNLDPEKKTILYIFNPLFSEYIDLFDHDLLVYHPYDDFSKLYSRGIAAQGNQRLATHSDIVITTSNLLKQTYEQYSSNVNFVPNGVDYELFSNRTLSKTEVPEGKSKLKVGYTGSINSKIDVALLLHVFEKLDQVDFFVVGSEGDLDSFQKSEMERLKALPNVHLLGKKTLGDVPSYMHIMDINIIPYRTDPDSFANAGYPLKLHEYLAVGKPIICSPIDSAFEFQDVLHIKNTAEEWIDCISAIEINEHEFSNEATQTRKNVAKQNTWQSRASKIESLMRHEVPRKVTKALQL